MQALKEHAPATHRSRARHLTFAVLTVLISLCASLAVIEWVLRYQDNQVASGERMDPGLIRYDRLLGWRLSPGWSGAHVHHDYRATYEISYQGFRSDIMASAGPPPVAVLGDSFAFGLGVDNGRTFVDLLNRLDQHRQYYNLSVPGYSTDQQYLLFEEVSILAAPQKVLLVVYLGNDLFDNLHAYPMQADYAKPYFKLDQGRLVLKNTPVPRASKPAAARNRDIASLVLGNRPAYENRFSVLLNRSAIARRLGLPQSSAWLDDADLEQRFSDAVSLFMALVDALTNSASKLDAEVSVVLLTGSSHINRPGSLSAQYQEYLRHVLHDRLNARGDIDVIDLANSMLKLDAEQRRSLYYPNEGHLTEKGHVMVASVLSRHLAVSDN